MVCRFVKDLRINLWRVYLGLNIKEANKLLIDPISEEFYRNLWQKTTQHNSDTYSKIFGTSIPANITKLADLNSTDAVKLKDYKDRSKKIQGHLIAFPATFLKDEKMTPTMMEKEYLLPRVLFL